MHIVWIVIGFVLVWLRLGSLRSGRAAPRELPSLRAAATAPWLAGERARRLLPERRRSLGGPRRPKELRSRVRQSVRLGSRRRCGMEGSPPSGLLPRGLAVVVMVTLAGITMACRRQPESPVRAVGG